MKNFRYLFASAILGLAALHLMPGPAQAAFVTYNFGGTMLTDLTGSPLAGTFSFGQSVSGSFVLDNSIADSDGDPAFGTFPGAITSISVTIGSYVASATGGDLYTQNDFPDDAVNVAAFVNDGPFVGSAAVTGASIGALDLGGILLVLQDSTSTALTSDAMPSPIGLSGFDSLYGLLEFYDPLDEVGDPVSLAFSLESLDSVAQISETGTLALFGLGIASVAFIRRRKLPTR